MRGLTLAGIVISLLVGACAPKIPTAPQGAEVTAKRAYDKAAADDLAGFTALGSPDLKANLTPEQFHQLHAVMPKGVPVSDRLLRWTAFYPNGGEPNRINVTRLYTYPRHVVLADSGMLQTRKDGPLRIDTFNLRIATNEEAAAMSFSLSGRSFVHYVVLTGAIMSALICVAALVTVIRSPKFKLKWLFAILSLIGVAKFTVNWSADGWSVQPISVQLFGAGAVSGGSPFDPWIISCSLPIGAAIAIWRAQKARRDGKAMKASEIDMFDGPRTEPADS